MIGVKVMFKRTLTKLRRSKLMLCLYRVIFFVLGIVIRKKDVIVFESFHGKQYSDNPRAIYEYINLQSTKYQLYWSFDKKSLPNIDTKDLNVIPKFTMKWLIIMASAKYWVFNTRIPLWIPKPRKTKFIQTWHGTPLKKLATDMDEISMPGTNLEKYKRNFIKDSKKWDYLISPNNYSTEIFKRAFQFNKQILESGYPRNDFLINHNNPEQVNRLKEKLNIPSDKKVILYAPTWRDDEYYSVGHYKFDLKLNLSKMQEGLSDDYVILLRMHYLIAQKMNVKDYQGFAYDVSNHDDIRELYLISDVLITDYSSVFFDYSILNRPMIFFTYDLEKYREKLRGFYFDFEKEAPGRLVYSTDEIIDIMKDLDNYSKSWSNKLKEFRVQFSKLEDGNASKRVAQEIFEI